MDKRGNDPLQEELRSSQVYKTLKGSGIPMAGKLAEGLGKAAPAGNWAFTWLPVAMPSWKAVAAPAATPHFRPPSKVPWSWHP